MNPETWTAIDRFIENHLVAEDPVLKAAIGAAAAAGLPHIQVSPSQGKFLHLLARMQRARSILELGTLGGYSTIWLARGLEPGGRLISLEAEPKHAEVARANLARAGLADRAEVRVGFAADGLRRLLAEAPPPFDLVFIDADKPGTADYFRTSLKLTRPGSVIVVDNVVRKGELADAASQDPAVLGMRRFFEAAAAEPRVSATAIQTVGSKGYDGFALAWVLG
ncbi:MAG: O-methyltransferase [Opitutaceae bacterium]